MSIKVENLNKTYDRLLSRKPPVQAVKNVSFEIASGEIYALLGPNGAGKTTIVKMLAGLITPTSGSIQIHGQNMGPSRPASYQQLSAVLEGIRNVYWRMTPLENLHYFANLRGVPSRMIKDRAIELLEMLEIEGKKKNQSQHLSRGMLQKLALATALITDPDILLLDEPTLGLDVGSARKIKETLIDLTRNRGKTILLTTHQMDLVEDTADRAGIIRKGELIREGTIAQLRNVFKSQIYRVRVRGRLRIPATWKKNRSARYLEERPEFTEIELDCKDKQGTYKILSELQSKNREILRFSRVADSLEDVFLMVISDDENPVAKGKAGRR